MYARWFQFAAFNPLFRSHGREWRLRLPWGWNRGEIGGFRETPSYNPDPKELHNAAIEPICKKYLELRYQLMPYLYSAAKETCETGMPIIRAMWLHYPGEANAVGRGDQYLYGRDLAIGLPAPRELVRLLDARSHRGRARDHPLGRSRDNTPVRARGRDFSHGPGEAVHLGKGRRAAHPVGASRRQWRVLLV
jgi:hypothetical protein